MKRCWEIIKEDLLKVLKEFHANGKLTRGCNTAFVVLIPKKTAASELKDYMPISLINSLYKVLAKVLALRMKKVMNLIISERQSAFVEGRCILDGVVTLNEIVEEAKRKKKGTILFKDDFAKAYDTVDWHFLDKMLEKMNFREKSLQEKRQ
ncbi:uncharacterized protein LOC131025504 [Salvia miltiorrhiza]|uniref:uncharacterized protein LOC131025504 n=1 Tax=Salvia miltiorrhiza TaxID=226208 RepID=UPI0025AD7D94|nr:uncharacterized protein LOC131025504 [Salvia miltiorrhiza]